MLYVYEVDKPFPDTRFNVHMEGGCIRFSETGFDVLLIKNDIDSADLELFTSENFRYGLFTAQSIPFLILDVDSPLRLQCSFNILTLTPPQAEQWLQGTCDAVTFYLIEQRGFILKATKTVSLSEALQLLLKETLTKQVANYQLSEEVDFQISNITRQYPIEEMLSEV